MKILALAALLLAAAAAPAAADAADDAALLAKYRAAIDACWRAGRDDCEGRLAEACMDGEPAGLSNLGMSQCLYAEAAFWDEQLNAEWRRLMPRVQAADAESRVSEPDFARREDSLRAAQRAWIAFRDAQCDFDYAIHGGGSIRQLYHPSCLGRITRARVEDLRAIAAEFGG